MSETITVKRESSKTDNFLTSGCMHVDISAHAIQFACNILTARTHLPWHFVFSSAILINVQNRVFTWCRVVADCLEARDLIQPMTISNVHSTSIITFVFTCVLGCTALAQFYFSRIAVYDVCLRPLEAQTEEHFFLPIALQERLKLQQLLQEQSDLLQSKYNVSLGDSKYQFSTSWLHRSSSRSLGAALTSAYFKFQPSFVVGVTGGSSTTGEHGWPYMLQRFLRTSLNLTNAEVRNAAHGTTSQLVTAACIRELVGTKLNTSDTEQHRNATLDLLMWEFAMNDELAQVSKPENEGGGDRARRRVAEVWLRAAVANRPSAIGFLHFWDLSVRQWSWNSTWLPDKAWTPTNDVVRQYGAFVDSFSVNTIRFVKSMAFPGWTSKKDFLRDGHHPNSASYQAAVDLIAYQLLETWIDYLKHFGEIRSVGVSDLVDPLVAIHPIRSDGQRPSDFPPYLLEPRCLYSAVPQFARFNRMSIFCQDGWAEWQSPFYSEVMPPNCSGWSTRLAGKADPARGDRKIQFIPAKCSETSGKQGSMEIRVRDVNRWKYLLLDCGSNNKDAALLRVSVNGNLVEPNVDVRGDMTEEFFSWMHEFNDSQALVPLSHTEHHTINICATTAAEKPVGLERIVIWHKKTN